MATMTEAIRGKYGFYAVDYPTFREIKEYHRLLLRAFRRFQAYQRWAAKKGSNRVIVERQGNQPTGVRTPIPRPEYPEFLAETVKGWGYAWGGEGDGEFREIRQWPEFLRFRGANLYHHVLAEYRALRRPAASPEDVATPDLPDGWRGQLAALRDYFATTA